MSTAEIIGYIGGIIVAIAIFSHLVFMARNRSGRDVTLLYASLLTVGLVLTFVYMYLINALAGIVMVGIQMVLAFFLLVGKVYFDRVGTGCF